jgi:uncharacterized membrane protein
MPQKERALTDERVESAIGNLLRAGVLLSAAIVLAGGVIYLIRYGGASPHYRVFEGEPGSLRRLGGIVRSAFSLHSRGLIQLGIVLLIATPVARVAFSAVAFALQRDRVYVVAALIVLAILTYGLLGGRV